MQAVGRSGRTEMCIDTSRIVSLHGDVTVEPAIGCPQTNPLSPGHPIVGTTVASDRLKLRAHGFLKP